LRDVAGARRALDEIVHERVDPARAGRPEQSDLLAREVGLREHAGANRVVDVVVDVRDPIDETYDLSFERRRLLRPGVRDDPVAPLPREVEPAPVALEHLDDPQRLLVVPEAAPEALLEALVERLLARVAEGRVAEVVAEADRLDEILVQPQRPRDAAR